MSPQRRSTFLLLAGLMVVSFPVPGTAQEDPSASVDRETGQLELELGIVLEDRNLRGALHSGLPLRIEIRVELWKDGFFDQQARDAVWRASVIHDAVSQSYELTVGDAEPRVLASLDAVAQVLDSAFVLEIRPPEPGRYYYLAELEMETLSLSDLEELRRWLQGDLGAVVRGERPPETAVTRGLRRIMVRALGLPARRERLRTETFTWPGEAGRSNASTSGAGPPEEPTRSGSGLPSVP